MFLEQRTSCVSREAQDKVKRKKRNRRRKPSKLKIKGHADVKGDKMEVEENQSIQLQAPVETQAEDTLQTAEKTDTMMVQAQTQTQNREVRNQFTQTPVVHHSDQETQTDMQEDINDKKNNAAESQLTGDKSALKHKIENVEDDNLTPERKSEDNDGAPEDPAKNSSAETPFNRSDLTTQKGTKPKSYAKAVSGEDRPQRQSNMEQEATDKPQKPSQNPR